MIGHGMTNGNESDADHDHDSSLGEPPVSPVLGEIVEELTRRLQAGEPVNVEEYIRRNPIYARPIRRLLPALRVMVSFGSTVVRDQPHGQSDDSD